MSGLANRFPLIEGAPDWDKYIAALAKITDIPAIAATDYFLIEGYKALVKLKDDNKLPNIKLLLPNIEFRLDNIVGGKRVNFHVIFSDIVKIEDIEDHFLSNIEIALEDSPWQPADIRKLKRSSLEELGRTYKSQHAPFTAPDFEIGCMTAVVKLDQIMELLKKNSLFKDRYITGLAEENLSLMSWNGQDHGVRKRMLQSSHFVLSGNPASIDWCLGKKHASPAEFISEFKSLKPCVIGSDAHDLQSIGVPPNGRFTWIKGDLTFNGLRQTLYEPEARISIGTEPPDEKDSTKVIKSLTVSGAKGWIADQIIDLNRDLVVIIGGKGSGKTALADLIGYAGGDFDISNKKAFLNTAREHIEGTQLTLEWENGGKDSTFEAFRSAPTEPKVRYLSQSFVESLCSYDQHTKLVRQIEDILFQYVPKTKRLGAKDFAALKEIQTRSVQIEIEKISKDISSLSVEIARLEEALAKRPTLEADLARFAKEKADLEAQKPPAANAEEQKEQEELQRLRDKRAALEKLIEADRILVGELEEFQTKARLIRSDIATFNADAKAKLKAWGLEDNAASLVISVPANLEVVIKDRIEALRKTVEAREGSPDTVAADTTETVLSISGQIAGIDAKSKLEAQRKQKLAEFGKRIAELTTKIEGTQKAIEELLTTKPSELRGKQETREGQYKTFFEKLTEKRQLLEELYKPLNDPAGNTTERGKVEFYARFNFDIKRFVADGMNLFDGRKMLVRGDAKLTEIASAFWRETESQIPAVTAVPLAALLDKLSSVDRPISSQLRQEYSVSHFYDWIYGVDYFDVEYGIKYEKVDLDKLSPGRKGVVLLMVYLDVDKDYRPLIIDQPEENLDNRSVYSTLVEYFRRAKRKRQVILVSHNANLVVNADAEQIIVANFELDKTHQTTIIEYTYGSLEFSQALDVDNPSILLRQGIRQHVCEILEGGDEAFQKRECKYGFAGR